MSLMFRADDSVRSWGRVERGRHQVARPGFRHELAGFPALLGGEESSILATGLRRSYGNSGLNRGGHLLDMTGLDRLMMFNPEAGVLRAEAGLSLDALLRIIVPRGFFLPVTPGSRFVTLGGAIANDVHGKNHHVAGTFGRHVRSLGLRRSTGDTLTLDAHDPTGLFAATIGGLGLTGIIEWVEIDLIRIESTTLDVETTTMSDLDAFFRLTAQDGGEWPYTVAWIDCLARGAATGRGIYSRGRFRQDGKLTPHAAKQRLSVPMDLPGFVLNSASIKAFNALYSAAQIRKAGHSTQHYAPFFYPLDAVGQWNRLYGPKGFMQYQCVIPPAHARDAVRELLERIARAGEGSFLAVLKTFGDVPSPGLLSFPMHGTTLALDFPNKGASTVALLASLDEVVKAAGGRLYPAKDGRMSAELFRAGYGEALTSFTPHIDPLFSSDFWRQVNA